VQTILIYVGPEGWDFGDLMPSRIGVVAVKGGTTPAAVGRLDLERFAELFGRDKVPSVAGMSGLAPALPPGRRRRRPTLDLDGGRVGRGWPGGVGGILVEPGFKLSDPSL
jgi:hypothetical protein